MNIKIIDSHAFDEPIYQLLGQYLIQHHFPTIGFYHIIAIHNHMIIALGMLYQKKRPPHRDYVLLHDVQNNLEPALFSRFISHLENNSKQRKLQYLLDSKDTHLSQLLELHHFKIARQTFFIELNRLQLVASNAKPVRTKNLNQLSIPEWHELKGLFHSNYNQYHTSVNGLAKDVCSEHLFNHLENINQEHSKILLNHHQPNHYGSMPCIMAYMLIGNSDKDSIEVAYIGGREESHLNDYLVFFQHAFKALHQRYKTIYFEADDTDYYAFSLVKELNYDLSHPFYTLIKDIN